MITPRVRLSVLPEALITDSDACRSFNWKNFSHGFFWDNKIIWEYFENNIEICFIEQIQC